jgi:ribonucleotide reductase beta subunit family protein with ferritin-like domain
MYVISLSNISIKTNFKQIARGELKYVQYSEGDYILCMTVVHDCVDYIKHILLLNIITIGLDTNYNNLQGSSPHNK